MEKKTDKNIYTVIFAVAMVLVVGSLLAYTASSLKPMITENERIEKQQNILYAMGYNNNSETSVEFIPPNEVADIFKEKVKEQLVLEYQDGKIIKTQTREEYMAENDGEEPYLIDVKTQQAEAKKGNPRKLPLFVGEREGKSIYVAPIYGKGLWDAIWGFVAVDEEMIVRGTFFDHAGETPGLGANIKQRYFMDDFYGEHLLTSNGVFKGIKVAKGNNDPKNDDKTDYEVDAIAGSTITGDGVTAMIKADLGLYVPYFKNKNSQLN
ncbi:MAG: Na(+)-translocating NADH-quinone reductase subunit C [Bacteroidota bacterium]